MRVVILCDVEIITTLNVSVRNNETRTENNLTSFSICKRNAKKFIFYPGWVWREVIEIKEKTVFLRDHSFFVPSTRYSVFRLMIPSIPKTTVP